LKNSLDKHKVKLIIATVFLATISMNLFMFIIVGDIFAPNIQTLFNYLLGNEFYYFAVLFFKFFGLILFVSFIDRYIKNRSNDSCTTFISYLNSGLFFLLILSDVLIPFSNYQFSLFFSNLAGGDELYRILIANYKVVTFLKDEIIEEFLVTFSLATLCLYVSFHISNKKLLIKRISIFLSACLILIPFITMLLPEGEFIEDVIFYLGYTIYQLMFPLILFLCTIENSGAGIEE